MEIIEKKIEDLQVQLKKLKVEEKKIKNEEVVKLVEKMAGKKDAVTFLNEISVSMKNLEKTEDYNED